MQEVARIKNELYSDNGLSGIFHAFCPLTLTWAADLLQQTSSFFSTGQYTRFRHPEDPTTDRQ